MQHVAGSRLRDVAPPPFASRVIDFDAAAVSRRIDPLTLRLFVSVIETGAIATAASRENIASSAVSKRLSDLEQHLKTRLLERSNRGIEPTSAGHDLLRLARAALNELDNIYWRIRDHASGARGAVRLIANLSAISEFLPERLSAYAARCPHVEVHLHERPCSEIAQAVADSEADVGVFVRNGVPPAGVDVFPFRHDELAVVVPCGHALAELSDATISDVLRYDIVGLPAGNQINQALCAAARATNIELKCRVRVSGFDAICSLVAAGAGVALVPRGIADRYAPLHGLGVLRLNEIWARREFLICSRSLDTLPMTARRFIEHLQAN